MNLNVKIDEQDLEKNLKKLSNLLINAKGYRTINGFAAICGTNADLIDGYIKNKFKALPTKKFLKLIAENSFENRVSYKDLLLACGYSLYENNDMEEIKNLYVRRGWFCYVDFGDRAIDSEYGGVRLCLVISNDTGNHFSSTVRVIPLTSRRRKEQKTHVNIDAKCGIPQDSTILCENSTYVSKRRLQDRNGVINKIADCPDFILKKVAVAIMKSEGLVNLNIPEDDVIEMLEAINEDMKYQYGYNRVPNVVSVYAI